MILYVIILVGLSGLTTAVYASLFGPRAAARRRLRLASRELVDGTVVTLTGKVVAQNTVLEAPLSGRDGVAFSASARIYSGNRNMRSLVAEVAESMMLEFQLETKQGKVVVAECDHVVIEFPPEPIIPRKIQRDQKFLDDHGYPEISAQVAGFDEVVIIPGMKISVHGAVRIEAAPDESNYRETGKRIVLTAPPGHPLTIGRPI